MERVIGCYTQGITGPTLICTGGLHGNEWAGIEALRLLLQMLDVERDTNPAFRFLGKMVALAGNLGALTARRRFVDVDLNRIWLPDHLDRPDKAVAESIELHDLKQLIDAEIGSATPGEAVYLLDIHTTTATGGIFTLPTDQPNSLWTAEQMHAPVILGIVERLRGTMISHYTRLPSPDITGLVFEAGQHDDPLSVNRAIAAIINCMRSIGCVAPEDIENRHDQLLIDYSAGLPRVARILHVHSITKEDDFRMQPGYHNFKPIARGELLAHAAGGPVVSHHDGLIVMPLYQPQGDEGFFVVEQIK